MPPRNVEKIHNGEACGLEHQAIWSGGILCSQSGASNRPRSFSAEAIQEAEESKGADKAHEVADQSQGQGQDLDPPASQPPEGLGASPSSWMELQDVRQTGTEGARMAIT